MNKMELVLYRTSYNYTVITRYSMSTQNMYATYKCVSKPFVSLINVITVICNCLQYNNDIVRIMAESMLIVNP